MADEKLLHYSKVLNVAYIYEDIEEKDPYYQKIFKSVAFYSYEDFIQQPQKCKEVDIIFVNFSGKDIKTLFQALHFLAAKKVIFTPYESNATFLKNALRYKVDVVNAKQTPKPQLEKLFQTLVKQITTEYKIQADTKRYQNLLHARIHFFVFINQMQATHICTELKELLECDSVDAFNKEFIQSGKYTEFVEFLQSNNKQKFMEFALKNGQKQTFMLSIGKGLDETKIVSFTLLHDQSLLQKDSADAVMNRLRFIEELKNHVVHKDSVQTCSVNLVLIEIANLQTIVKEHGNYVAYQFSKELIRYLKEYVDESATVASWGADGYAIMSENRAYESLKEGLEQLNEKISYEVFDHKIVPFLKSALLSIKDDDLNASVAAIDQFFSNKALDLELAKRYDYYECCQIKESMEQKERLFYYFSNIMYAQSPLKLLNIYKGVHIATNAYIEKVEADTIIVKAKNIQLYTMQIEKKTVLQSASLPKDVEVAVDYVDLKRNVAAFTHPQFLEFSANNRETTRVQSDFRFPIKMKQEKTIHSGEILDLSMRSVAIKFPVAIQQQFVQGRVSVSFRVPVETHDEGFFQTQIYGKLIRFDELDHKYCKAIVLLEMEEPDEGYVLEYIYKRQKEIIFEIKKLALKGLANGV